EGNAERDRGEAQRRRGRGHGGRRRAPAHRRPWHGHPAAPAADAGSAWRFPQGRGREVVADHQGGERQTGVSARCTPQATTARSLAYRCRATSVPITRRLSTLVATPAAK